MLAVAMPKIMPFPWQLFITRFVRVLCTAMPNQVAIEAKLPSEDTVICLLTVPLSPNTSMLHSQPATAGRRRRLPWAQADVLRARWAGQGGLAPRSAPTESRQFGNWRGTIGLLSEKSSGKSHITVGLELAAILTTITSWAPSWANTSINCTMLLCFADALKAISRFTTLIGTWSGPFMTCSWDCCTRRNVSSREHDLSFRGLHSRCEAWII